MNQQLSQLQDWRRDFVIPVRTLRVERFLLLFHGPPILLEDEIGEPDKYGPNQLRQAWCRRPAEHHQAERVVRPLLAIKGDVDVP